MTAQPQTGTPNELEAALVYAQQAIPVFPTNPLDKKPLINGGFKNATTDENQNSRLVAEMAQRHDRRADRVSEQHVGSRCRP